MSRDTAGRSISLLALWFGVAAPPLAWSAHLLLGYLLVSLYCHTGNALFPLLLPLLTLLTLALTLAAGVVAYLVWQHAGVGGRTEIGGPVGRSGFMGLAGVLISGMFFLAILMGGMPSLMLSPC